MYDYISGIVAELTASYVVVDNNGIGYFLKISLNTYEEIQNKKDVKLFVHQVLREDVNDLYGFSTRNEREIFRHLISVSGIGANTARLMLSSLKPDEITTAIIESDVNRIKSVKGIGLKTAQRVIVELKDKVTKSGDESLSFLSGEKQQNIQEAVSALVALGFNKKQAEKNLQKIVKENPDASLEQLVKLGIKLMSHR